MPIGLTWAAAEPVARSSRYSEESGDLVVIRYLAVEST